MKTKIEITQVSEFPSDWLISFSVEGLTLKKVEMFKKLPDIIENYVRDLYEAQKKAKE